MTIKILSLNIWHDSGPWPERAKLIRAWIERLQPDLIGFQEVLRGSGRDQVPQMLDGLGYHTDFAMATPFWNDRSLEFGNAIASRWPIRDREELALPHLDSGETRCALSVIVDAPVGPVSFTVTHLNWKLHHGWVRVRQVQALTELVLRRRSREGFPPIITGDFNAEPESDEIRYMNGLATIDGRSIAFHDAWRVAGRGADPHTWNNRNPYAATALEPDRRIDYIFAGYPDGEGRGHVVGCRVVCDEPQDGVWPSDHFGVFAELATEPVRPRLPG